MANPVATNPLSYNTFLSTLCTMAVVQYTTPAGIVVPSDPAVVAILPALFDYAELRIQRDLDLSQGQYANNSYTLTSGTNTLSLSVNDFIVVQTVAYVSSTKTIPMLPSSKEFIQTSYNDTSYLAPPAYFAAYGGDLATAGTVSQNLIFGPTPDQSYPLVITGLQRMPSLYGFGSSNTTAGTSYTFISTYLPDLLVTAAMIFISGYQRNFGRESDDPQMSVSWESQYQALLKGATIEEYRRKFQASAWTSLSSSPVATPTR